MVYLDFNLEITKLPFSIVEQQKKTQYPTYGSMSIKTTEGKGIRTIQPPATET